MAVMCMIALRHKVMKSPLCSCIDTNAVHAD